MKELCVECLASFCPVLLITRQDISHLQLYHSHVSDASFSVSWLSQSFISGWTPFLSPRKEGSEREKRESSKVTFGVSPLESVSSWQARDRFNFSLTVRSSLLFKCLWDRYKQRKMLPDFSVLSEGHSFLQPYLSVSNGPSVIPARYLLRMDW